MLFIIYLILSFLDSTTFRGLGQKYKNIFVVFLVQMKSLEFALEINWPLVRLVVSPDRSSVASLHPIWWIRENSDSFFWNERNWLLQDWKATNKKIFYLSMQKSLSGHFSTR